jgi:hypothetical protein
MNWKVLSVGGSGGVSCLRGFPLSESCPARHRTGHHRNSGMRGDADDLGSNYVRHEKLSRRRQSYRRRIGEKRTLSIYSSPHLRRHLVFSVGGNRGTSLPGQCGGGAGGLADVGGAYGRGRETAGSNVSGISRVCADNGASIAVFAIEFVYSPLALENAFGEGSSTAGRATRMALCDPASPAPPTRRFFLTEKCSGD